MTTVTKEFHFEAAHRLELEAATTAENARVYGACSNLHGHTYILWVTLRAPALLSKLRTGMITDFRDISRIVKAHVIDELDHNFLNSVPWLTGPITAENMVSDIARRLCPVFPDVDVVHIRLYEGGNRTSWVDWYSEPQG